MKSKPGVQLKPFRDVRDMKTVWIVFWMNAGIEYDAEAIGASQNEAWERLLLLHPTLDDSVRTSGKFTCRKLRIEVNPGTGGKHGKEKST